MTSIIHVYSEAAQVLHAGLCKRVHVRLCSAHLHYECQVKSPKAEHHQQSCPRLPAVLLPVDQMYSLTAKVRLHSAYLRCGCQGGSLGAEHQMLSCQRLPIR